MYYIYILECCDGTYYTGYTNDIEKRLRAHNDKKGAKYTKGRTHVTLVYKESCDSKPEALKREYAIKRLSRNDKKKLINTKFEELSK